MGHDEKAVDEFRVNKIDVLKKIDLAENTALGRGTDKGLFISGSKLILATGSAFETVTSA